MVTQFGKMLRNLRMDTGELLKDMADKLEVKPSFLSAVECGEKNVPDAMFKRFIIKYCIPEEKIPEWKEAVEKSATQFKINSKSSSMYKRECAYTFMREFNDLGEDKIKKIMEVLN